MFPTVTTLPVVTAGTLTKAPIVITMCTYWSRCANKINRVITTVHVWSIRIESGFPDHCLYLKVVKLSFVISVVKLKM